MMFLVQCTVLFFGLGDSSNHVEAFLRNRPFTRLPMYPSSVSSEKTISTTTTGLFAETVQQTPEQKTRRKELLKRDGSHFQLDRLSGTIEFGAAANLVTVLESSQGTDDTRELIESWLTDDDGRGLAQSIWEEDLLTDLGNGVFRLQTMPLQFITLQLQPAVDIQMWTQPSGKNKAGRLLPPIFKMQSLTFEPNLQILPGMSVTARSLGLVVEVVGDLRPTPDGKGVTGKICFQSTGVLPPPLRIVPEAALQLAVDTINDAVVSFAISSFQKGARQKYLEYKTKHVAKMLEKQALS